MKKTIYALFALSVAACGSGDDSGTKSGKAGSGKDWFQKPGDSVEYKCPGDQQSVSLTLVKDKYYSVSQGMLMVCDEREDKDGYQNYNTYSGVSLGIQIRPNGDFYLIRFGTEHGPCELVKKTHGGYANPRCLVGKE